jgi:hypothetical protein
VLRPRRASAAGTDAHRHVRHRYLRGIAGAERLVILGVLDGGAERAVTTGVVGDEHARRQPKVGTTSAESSTASRPEVPAPK